MDEAIKYVFTVIAAGVGAYLASYLNEKGKDKATKENFDSVMSQLRKTTTETEEIKKKFDDEGWLTKQQWERREKFYANILTLLKEGEIAYSELNDYYMLPGSEYNDGGLVDSDRFKSLQKDAHNVVSSVQKLSGASSLYLSEESNNALKALFVTSWEAGNFSSHHEEYITMMHKALDRSYEQVRAEAIRTLKIKEVEQVGDGDAEEAV